MTSQDKNNSKKMEEHFHSFVQSHPGASYEEWVEDWNPEAKEDCLLEGLGGELLIDSKYYTEDNVNRQLWNSNVDSRHQVPAATAVATCNGILSDLLGGGELAASSQLTPPTSPAKANKDSDNSFPLDQDLMSFD